MSRIPFAATLAAALVAAASLIAPSALAQNFSTSIIRPTVLAADAGSIAGLLPGAQGARSYYFALEAKTGILQTQIRVSANSSATRSITLDLLGPDSNVKDSYYVKTSRNEQNEATRGFRIDSAGSYSLRVTVEGPEAGRFCVLLGGSALPDAKAADCPGDPAPAVTRVEAAPAPPAEPRSPPPRPEPPPAPKVEAPPPPKSVEVVTSKCEQRLRVGSEVLFDFDKSVLRPDALPAIDYVARTITEKAKPVVVEGHTDSIGTDSYNVRLSEQRAATVRAEIARRLTGPVTMDAYGYGKSKPIADNQNPDGTDNPEGRQRNRRVEIVINTCK
ncbi:MAG: OmpA family protein [Bradyrhizobium sp.]|nr:OmpA family protein [Bradyrhizobium sp.]